MLRKEECALGMEQKSKGEPARDALIISSKRVCALGMEHR